jgi:hypothetical protein
MLITMSTQLTERELNLLVEKSVQKALQAELMKLRTLFLPYISAKEQKELEKLYGKPSRRISKKTHTIRL